MEGVLVRTVQDNLKKTNQSNIPKADVHFKDALDKSLPQMSVMITEALRQPIQQSFVQYFQDKLIPSFDQSCRVMFNQLNSTFEDGIQDLIASQRSNEVPSSSANANNNNVLADQLRVTVQSLLDVTSNMSSSMLEAQSKILSHQAQAPAQATHQPHHQSLATQQLQHNQPLPLPPAPSHPTPPPVHSPAFPHPSQTHFTQSPQVPLAANQPPHAALSRLVAMGRYEEAFDMALSLSNLSVVTWLCSHIGDPQVILNGQALRVSQPVLVSLVQQLGFDLDTDTMVKLIWLQAVIPFVDPRSPHIPEHQLRDVFARLLGKLEENYSKYADPANPYSSSFKMLYHIVSKHVGRSNLFV